MNVLVLAPHPDDDILACGGTIALKVHAGWAVFVVYLTDGRHSHSHTFDVWTGPTTLEMKRMRHAEAVAAERLLGVPENQLDFLDLEDGTLNVTVEKASERVASVLKRISPAEVYYPAAVDRHRDHRATASIIEFALEKTRVRPRRYEYVVWRPEGGIPAPVGECIRVDISEMLGLKKRAISEHRSQVCRLFPWQPCEVLPPDFLAPFLLPYEEFHVAVI